VLWDVLQAARKAYRQTDGAFDVSVGPIMAVWGFHRKRDTLPSDTEIQEALGRVGLDRVQFDETQHAVRFTVEGMSLDFGGIAKGYALEAVSAILARHRIDRYLVDLGGNVACTPLPPPGREQFFIGIRNPFDLNGLLGRLPVVGRAVSTSGNYERRIVIQGKEIGHIVDPRTGRPVSGPAGVTALTPGGTDSDVFSTAVYVAGKALAETLAASVPGTGFVLVSGTPEAPRLEVVGDAILLDAAEGAGAPQATPRP
jgi:thiamine biosynthesis lipoprotein